MNNSEFENFGVAIIITVIIVIIVGLLTGQIRL